MRYQPVSFLRERNIISIRSFLILILTCITIKFNLGFSGTLSSLQTLPLNGYFSFDEIHHADRDFGNRYRFLPLAVLHPKSVSDIAITINHVWQLGPGSELTVAARGHGHSLQGQAQAHRGVVINMESFRGPQMQIHPGKNPYVDVRGGELWINILHESLKYGLAPKSWTDYLHLTVGGTLSNAGISGQAFRHGPQISNVHQLFHNIVTFEQVKWIRVLYSDFSAFTRDQEHLISEIQVSYRNQNGNYLPFQKEIISIQQIQHCICISNKAERERVHSALQTLQISSQET